MREGVVWPVEYRKIQVLPPIQKIARKTAQSSRTWALVNVLTYLLDCDVLFFPVPNDAAFRSRKASRSVNPPPGLLEALLCLRPPTRRKDKPAVFCCRDLPLGPPLDTRAARDPAVPLASCLSTFWAVLEGPFEFRLTVERVVGRVLVVEAEAAAGFLVRAVESMSRSPSPSIRLVRPRF